VLGYLVKAYSGRAVLLGSVKKLPTAKQMRGLTAQTVKAVALCYLAKLKRDQSDNNAIDFTKATIDHFDFQARVYRTERDSYADSVKLLLRYVPHCRVDTERDMERITTPLFLDWCEFSEVKFELIHLDSDAIYLFDNEEDRILFKLRWL
jgi:hypothetical protein